MLLAGGGDSIAMGPQLPRHPSAPLQPAGPMGNPMGTMGEQADSNAFQPVGLTDPHNSVGSGALMGQLATTSQAASPASSLTVLPAPAPEDVKASKHARVNVCLQQTCSTCSSVSMLATEFSWAVFVACRCDSLNLH